MIDYVAISACTQFLNWPIQDVNNYRHISFPDVNFGQKHTLAEAMNNLFKLGTSHAVTSVDDVG